MSHALIIRGGQLIDPAHRLDRVADLYIEDGILVALGEAPEGFPAKAEVFDATGLQVLPGLVDCRARLLGGEAEAGNLMRSETLAAAAGGITTVLVPPTRDFPLDKPATVAALRSASERITEVHIHPVCGMLTGDGAALTEMGSLAEQGCAGAGNSHFIADSQLLLNALKYAHTFDLTICATTRDSALGRGYVHLSGLSAELGLPVISEPAETLEISRWLLLSEQVDCRLHLAALSTARGVEMVAAARARGQRVTAAVPIHNLILTDSCIADYDSAYHLMPPLRSESDRQALLQGVREGMLSICSNHRPLVRTAKYEVFGAGEPGAAGMETLLPLGLSLVRAEELSLEQLIVALTSAPSGAFNLPAGSLTEGAVADICLLDPEARWTPDAGELKTSGDNCIETGTELQGRVVGTCRAGRLHLNRGS